MLDFFFNSKPYSSNQQNLQFNSMAAVLLLGLGPYFPSINNRDKQHPFCLCSINLLKTQTAPGGYLSLPLPNSKENIKLYMVPYKPFSRFGPMKCSTTNGTVELQPRAKDGDVSYNASAPENLQRSKTFLDSSSNSMNDFESQLHEFFLEVKSMLKKGNIDAATDLLKANYEAVKEQIDAGAKGMEQAALLDIIAFGFLGIGDFEFVDFLLEMLNRIISNVKSTEPLLDSVLLHMGSMYTKLGKFENAKLMYGRALNILEGLFGKTSPFLITSLLGLAKVYASIQRSSKAVEIYHRAVTILEISRGHESEDIVVPLSGLGNLLIKDGKAADAENCFSRILEIYAKLYGDHDGRVGIALCSVAHAKCAKGDLDEAIELYRIGLQVIEDSKYMDLDDVLEKTRIDLAELLHVTGRAHEGRELLEKCLLVSEKYKGREHPSSVNHLLNLATSYSRSKNYAEAERLLRMGLEIMKTSLGPNDQSVTVPMLHLAVVLYHVQRDIEAEYFALEAVRIREWAFGNESLLVGEALDCLVSIQARLGKDDTELLVLLQRVLSIQERELGYESKEVTLTLKKMVFYLNKMGKKDEIKPLQRRLTLLRTKYKQQVHY